MDFLFGTDEATSTEVVEIARDATASVSTTVETPVEDAPPAPESTTAQVVVEAGVAGGGVDDPSSTDMANAMKTPEAVVDATMAEVPAGGEYVNVASSCVYVVSALVVSGLGENTEDLPPVAPTEPVSIAQPAPVMKKRR